MVNARMQKRLETLEQLSGVAMELPILFIHFVKELEQPPPTAWKWGDHLFTLQGGECQDSFQARISAFVKSVRQGPGAEVVFSC